MECSILWKTEKLGESNCKDFYSLVNAQEQIKNLGIKSLLSVSVAKQFAVLCCTE